MRSKAMDIELKSATEPNIPGFKSAEKIQLERDWGPLAPVIKTFSDLGKIASGEAESVGLEAEPATPRPAANQSSSCKNSQGRFP